jgi:hypothetical protein
VAGKAAANESCGRVTWHEQIHLFQNQINTAKTRGHRDSILTLQTPILPNLGPTKGHFMAK